jgi:hypothetical protein
MEKEIIGEVRSSFEELQSQQQADFEAAQNRMQNNFDSTVNRMFTIVVVVVVVVLASFICLLCWYKLVQRRRRAAYTRGIVMASIPAAITQQPIYAPPPQGWDRSGNTPKVYPMQTNGIQMYGAPPPMYSQPPAAEVAKTYK